MRARMTLGVALLVAAAGGAIGAGRVSAAELTPLPAVVHVHSDLSTGEFSLDRLADLAERQGVGALLLAENYLLRVSYGVPPFRAATLVTHEEAGVLSSGIRPYLERVAEAQRRHPGVLLVPGVEVMPHYHWTVSPLALDMVLHDTQKNLLVFGVRDAEALGRLPVTGNPAAARFGPWTLLDALPGLLAVPGMRLLARKRIRRRALGPGVVVVRDPAWFRGGTLCALALVALVRAWPFANDAYPPWTAAGLAPHQALIDHVNRLGGITVWSFPEAWDAGERRVGPIRVSWRTDPYPDDLLRTVRFTAFGGIYEHPTTFTQVGGRWDRLLTEYAKAERSRPAWALGESGFHAYDAGKRLGPIQTVFLVTDRSEAAMLEAFRQGRLYALARTREVGLRLLEYAVSDGKAVALSGGTLATAPSATIEVRVAIDASDSGAYPIKVSLVRNGTAVEAWAATTPFRAVHRDTVDGTPTFYRIDVRGPVPHHLLTNPIFVRAA